MTVSPSKRQTAAPHSASEPRSVAIVGPQGSGKTKLFEALLTAAGSPPRRAADTHGIGSEVHVGHCAFLGDPWALIDCPGSIEFAHAADCALAVADFAVVVCGPAPDRAAMLAPLLRRIEATGTPYLVFINRIDTLTGHVRDTLAAVQARAGRPLVLRQVPIHEGDGVSGYVDVVSERAYRYRRGEPSELMSLPVGMAEREQEARSGLVEILADHDDTLLEKVVEDIVPSPSEIYEALHRDQAAGAVASVLLGAAEQGNGIRRLWKALRHDAPHASETALRRGVDAQGGPLVQVFRTVHAGHGGKLSYARIWRGPLKDGAIVPNAALGGQRVSGVTKFPGGEATKAAEAGSGEIVALGRLDGVATGDVLGNTGSAQLMFPERPEPVYELAISGDDRKDDVRLSGALHKLAEEDASLVIRRDAESGETILAGQGEIHLKTLIERLEHGFGMHISTHRPRTRFRETIRYGVRQHGRLKRQTGGHGQFADVTLDLAPRGRGEGFLFANRIVGGVIPKQYVPAVGDAAEEALRKGAFGYPVVDVEVTLVDGGFHAVDSSDMAFRNAARMAITEALPKAGPVLLEPIDHVTISVPNEYTAAAQRLLSGRRAQIVGYAEHAEWPGWDDLEALTPEAELHDLIIELRSLTMGLGTYRHRFDHLAEAHGRVAQEAAVAAR